MEKIHHTPSCVDLAPCVVGFEEGRSSEILGVHIGGLVFWQVVTTGAIVSVYALTVITNHRRLARAAARPFERTGRVAVVPILLLWLSDNLA